MQEGRRATVQPAECQCDPRVALLTLMMWGVKRAGTEHALSADSRGFEE